MARSGNPFDWSGGHPALDLVNTLDERPSEAPVERLATYADLVGFAALSGLIEADQARRLRSLDARTGARVVKRVRALREHAYAILGALCAGCRVPPVSLDAVAREVRLAHQSRVFAVTGKAITYSWSSRLSAEMPLYACALAVEALLVGEGIGRIRQCGATDCEVYFVDTSKAHRRQWCSMQNCGNREKQRRWRSVSRA